MDNDLPESFKRRFLKAFDASDFTSQRSLSLAAGWSESRINRIFTGQFNHSKDGPGFFGVVRVCKELGITPDYLAGISKFRRSDTDTTMNALSFIRSLSSQNDAPSIKSLMRAYVRSGHRLEAFGQFMDYCDVYEIPDESTRKVKVRSVGVDSLSAMRMGENNAVVLQEAYDRADGDFQEQIFSAHLRAFRSGVTVEPDSIDQVMENRPVYVKIDYIRVSMHLKDADGKECILIYCELIPQ